MTRKHATDRPFARRDCWRGIATIGLLAALAAPAALSKPAKAKEAAAPAETAEQAKTRKRWEAIVTVYGEEDSGRYSLRVLDPDAKEPADFILLSVWKYDRDEKKWVPLDKEAKHAKIVLPKDKPADAPEDSQVLANLPMTQKEVGCYYVKWSVNGVEGSTFTRLGPRAFGAKDVGKPKDGQMVTDVPIDLNKAERIILPDPRVATKGK